MQKEVHNGSATLEPLLKFLLRLTKNDPAIVLLGIYQRKIKTYVHRKTCTRVFIAPLSNFIQKSIKLETIQMFINRSMDKNKLNDHIFMQWNLLINEKELLIHTAAWINLTDTVKQMKPSTKEYLLCNFIFQKFKGKTNPWWLY